MKNANSLIEAHLLITENIGETKFIQKLSNNYNYLSKKLLNINSTLVQTLLTISVLKINNR